ncbi:MAG: hypothetical protein ACP5N1_06280 [Candidatus Woesearchaeota archaeon]
MKTSNDKQKKSLKQYTKEEVLAFDRKGLLEILKTASYEYLHQKTSNWSKIKGYDKLIKLSSDNEYITQLRVGYYDCNPDKVEELLKIMPYPYKNSIKYTLLVDELLSSLKHNVYETKSWQPIKADTMQNLLIHHPNKEITILGLECLVANNIGSGTNRDIKYQICTLVDECRFIFTEYYNAQDTKGHYKYSDNCLIHSNKIYTTKKSRMELWNKWDKLIDSNCR